MPLKRRGPERVVVQPGILEELFAAGGVAGAADPVVQGAAGLVRGVVAADVVAQEVVREQQVARVPGDLLGRGQDDRRVGAEIPEGVLGVVGGVREVRSRPEPQVAWVISALVGQEYSGAYL